MIKVITKKDFTFNGEFYEAKTDLTNKIKDFKKIVKLNEKGFIESLTTKDLMQIKKEINKKEEE